MESPPAIPPPMDFRHIVGINGTSPLPPPPPPSPPSTSDARGLVRNIVAQSAVTVNQFLGAWSPLPFLPPFAQHTTASPGHRRSLSADQTTKMAVEDVGTPSMHRCSSVAIESRTVVVSSTTTTISTCSNHDDTGAVAPHRTLERLLELGMNPFRLATAVLSWSLSRLGVSHLLQDVASNGGDAKHLDTELLISEYAREIARADPTLTDFEAALLQTLAERRVRQNMQQYGEPTSPPQPLRTSAAKVQRQHGPRIVIPVDVSCSVVCQPSSQHYRFPLSPRTKSVFTTTTTTTSATILDDPETWSRSRSVSASVVSTAVELDSQSRRRQQPKVPANGRERLPQSAFHLRPMTSLRRVSFQSDSSDSDDESSQEDGDDVVDARVVGELSVETTTTRMTTRTTAAMTGPKVVTVDVEA